jgi:isocitrate dehydrogenase (NAD+)
MSTSKPIPEVILIEGDGIGPEISQAVLYVLEEAGAKINWKKASAGLAEFEANGDALPVETIDAIRSSRIALKGPTTTPIGEGFRSINVGLRKELDLYANFRPIKSFPQLKTRYDNVDIVFIRENTEGLYSGLEHEIVPGVVTSLKVSTRVASLRIAEFAFAYAERAGRKKVTAIHKANIMKLSDGLALDCYREIANQHPQIEYDERIIDAAAMSLVLDPSPFDVLVMENLYGDILSDLGAGLIGGLGLAPSGNFGQNCAVFEAVHGSAPDIAGKSIANPSALLLSSIELLDYIGQTACAKRVSRALRKTFETKEACTADLGGSSSTMEFAQEVCKRLDE